MRNGQIVTMPYYRGGTVQLNLIGVLRDGLLWSGSKPPLGDDSTRAGLGSGSSEKKTGFCTRSLGVELWDLTKNFGYGCLMINCLP